MSNEWTLHLAPMAIRFAYTLQRGEAVRLRDALAVLKQGPAPDGVADLHVRDVYNIERDIFAISYQVVATQRIMRVLLIERARLA